MILVVNRRYSDAFVARNATEAALAWSAALLGQTPAEGWDSLCIPRILEVRFHKLVFRVPPTSVLVFTSCAAKSTRSRSSRRCDSLDSWGYRPYMLLKRVQCGDFHHVWQCEDPEWKAAGNSPRCAGDGDLVRCLHSFLE